MKNNFQLSAVNLDSGLYSTVFKAFSTKFRLRPIQYFSAFSLNLDSDLYSTFQLLAVNLDSDLHSTFQLLT